MGCVRACVGAAGALLASGLVGVAPLPAVCVCVCVSQVRLRRVREALLAAGWRLASLPMVLARTPGCVLACTGGAFAGGAFFACCPSRGLFSAARVTAEPALGHGRPPSR
mmetsp:Transcript_76897/g.243028  ORF Transcript_76897/g.243028 Transcript_76897/m.243028 type:complete len:110 (+) Transcript_76897:149-478(+)